MTHSQTQPSTSPGTVNSDLRGVHYDFLKDRLPSWFTDSDAKRQRELAEHPLEIPAWYRKATSEQKKALAETHKRYRETLNRIDTTLGSIKDVLAFAEQPLKDAIKAKFNLELDVKNVYFARKFAPKGRDDLLGAFVFDQQKDPRLTYEYRGTSLLEAALANFEPDEEKPLACDDCHIITDWNRYDGEVIPSFETLKADARPIPTHEFARLCRTLDLGALYQKHIKEVVQPEDASEREVLEKQLEEHQRQKLAVCIELARHSFELKPGSSQIKSGISADVYQMLKQVLVSDKAPKLDDKPVTFAALRVFGIELTGPLLIGPERQSSDRVERLVVYLPDDPEQPLKEYASSAEFMVELRARLHKSDYRRFFSQFVPMRQQGIFFAKLNQAYKPSDVGPQADYPLKPKPAKLPMDEAPIKGDPWQQLRQRTIYKIFNDARAVVVPTGDEDRKARVARLESYLDAVNSVFNLAAFVVPGLGWIMLAVGATQMFDEAFEGIEAAEEREWKEMWAHFSSVALNVAFLATGAKVVPRINASPTVDHLKPVTLPNGKQKLWKPDISPYKAGVTLPPEATPDALGLYAHNGQTVLPLEGDYYVVEPDVAGEQYRIQHPTRPEAYTPELVSNGEGAWHHELEHPLTWKGAKLMRRLGHLVDGLSDAELEQVWRVSGVDAGVLRRLHVEGEKVPAILLETLKKFRAYSDAKRVARGIRSGALSSALCSYAASLAVELPGWPAGRAIEAFTGDRLSGPSTKYGNANALPQDTLPITRSDLMNGRLPQQIIESSSEAEVKSLLPQYTPSTAQERIRALQKKLAEQADSARARLTRSLYAEKQPSANAAVAVVQRDFTGLSTAMVEELLADATPAELETLTTAKRVPLRLAEGARRLQQHMRLTHAYEGLYLEALVDSDTEILVLNSLKALPGWTDDIRLEVRVGHIEGELRASVGPDDAMERKVLLWKDDGRYEARNERDEHLHGADDLYSSIQHALPDRQRQAIGLPHVGQGSQLRAKIIEHQLPRDQLRPLLKMRPRQHPFFKPPVRLPGDRIGYPLSDHPDVRQWERTIEERLRALYPAMPPEEVNSFIEGMDEARERSLRNRELEYESFKSTLTNWYLAQAQGVSEEERSTVAFRQRREARVEIMRALKQAWQRTGEVDIDNTGYPQGQRIDLSDVALHGQLDELPPLTANFDHVTYLDLSGTGLEGNVNGFLRHFKRLRTLNLGNNNLVGLPENLGKMTQLSSLDLADNLIELDATAVAQLRRLKRLRFLELEGNPLGLPPDIGQMPDLQFLLLAETGINTWPVGLFDQVRPRTFYLDMKSNSLEIIPDVEPGSVQAELVARTLISHEPANISAQNLQRIRDYGHSVGFEPNRPVHARGAADSVLWAEGLTEEQWTGKQDLWADLENEHGSEPFFNELRKLAESADAVAPDKAAKVELCRKVWSMIEATAGNTALREKLFRMAAAPTTCVDAGAQLFNAMGLEVLIVQAYELGAHDLIEPELLTLARGKSRLDELGRIARERIGELVEEGHQFSEFDEDGHLIPHLDAQGQPVTDIDEVEIHMIYPTALAKRLELPWQSREMMFSAPDVSTAMLETAYVRVLEKEQGPMLQERLIEQPFWVDYLKRNYPEPFRALHAKGEPLLDLQAAQQAWLDSTSSVQKIHWRSEIIRLAKVVGKPETEVKPGTVMSDAQYYAEMENIAAQEKALIGKLTGEAMKRARLPRDEAAIQRQANTTPRT
ncbi:NEL-type E3 ubiquitin ligase domain-containing protein [Pseudomonas sp. ZT5P21]